MYQYKSYPYHKFPKKVFQLKSSLIPLYSKPEIPKMPELASKSIGGFITFAFSIVVCVSYFLSSLPTASWFIGIMTATTVLATFHMIYSIIKNRIIKQTNKEIQENYEYLLTKYKEEEQKYQFSLNSNNDSKLLTRYRNEQIVEFFKKLNVNFVDANSNNDNYEVFYFNLNKYFNNSIIQDKTIKQDKSAKIFVPNYIVNLKEVNLFIAVEIDAPYSLNTRVPITYVTINDEQTDYSCFNHDEIYLNTGLVVVHFAEEQVIANPLGCCKYISKLIFDCYGSDKYYNLFKEGLPIEKINFWTYQECVELEKQHYREKYLKLDVPSQEIKPLIEKEENSVDEVLAKLDNNIDKIQQFVGEPKEEIAENQEIAPEILENKEEEEITTEIIEEEENTPEIIEQEYENTSEIIEREEEYIIPEIIEEEEYIPVVIEEEDDFIPEIIEDEEFVPEIINDEEIIPEIIEREEEIISEPEEENIIEENIPEEIAEEEIVEEEIISEPEEETIIEESIPEEIAEEEIVEEEMISEPEEETIIEENIPEEIAEEEIVEEEIISEPEEETIIEENIPEEILEEEADDYYSSQADYQSFIENCDEDLKEKYEAPMEEVFAEDVKICLEEEDYGFDFEEDDEGEDFYLLGEQYENQEREFIENFDEENRQKYDVYISNEEYYQEQEFQLRTIEPTIQVENDIETRSVEDVEKQLVKHIREKFQNQANYKQNIELESLENSQEEVKEETKEESKEEIVEEVKEENANATLVKLVAKMNDEHKLENWLELLLVCQQIIEIEPKYQLAYLRRSTAYGNLGNFEQALLCCQKAIELDNTNADAYYNAAIASMMLKNYYDSIEYFNKAIKNNIGQLGDIYFTIANLYDKLDDQIRRREYLQMSSDQGCEKAKIVLAKIAKSEGDAFNSKTIKIKKLQTAREGVSYICFSVNDEFVAIADMGRKLKIYRTSDWSIVYHEDLLISAMTFSRNNKFFAIGGQSFLRILEVNQNGFNQVFEQNNFESSLKKIFFHPFSNDILFVSDNFSIQSIDTKKQAASRVLSDFQLCSLSRDMQYFAGKDYFNNIVVYRINVLSEIFRLKVENKVSIKCMALSSDASILIFADGEFNIHLYNTQLATRISVISLKSEVLDVKISDDSKFFVVVTADKILRFFDISSNEQYNQISLKNAPKQVVMSNVNNLLAIGNYNIDMDIIYAGEVEKDNSSISN